MKNIARRYNTHLPTLVGTPVGLKILSSQTSFENPPIPKLRTHQSLNSKTHQLQNSKAHQSRNPKAHQSLSLQAQDLKAHQWKPHSGKLHPQETLYKHVSHSVLRRKPHSCVGPQSLCKRFGSRLSGCLSPQSCNSCIEANFPLRGVTFADS